MASRITCSTLDPPPPDQHQNSFWFTKSSSTTVLMKSQLPRQRIPNIVYIFLMELRPLSTSKLTMMSCRLSSQNVASIFISIQVHRQHQCSSCCMEHPSPNTKWFHIKRYHRLLHPTVVCVCSCHM